MNKNADLFFFSMVRWLGPFLFDTINYFFGKKSSAGSTVGSTIPPHCTSWELDFLGRVLLIFQLVGPTYGLLNHQQFWQDQLGWIVADFHRDITKPFRKNMGRWRKASFKTFVDLVLDSLEIAMLEEKFSLHFLLSFWKSPWKCRWIWLNRPFLCQRMTSKTPVMNPPWDIRVCQSGRLLRDRRSITNLIPTPISVRGYRSMTSWNNHLHVKTGGLHPGKFTFWT